MKYFRKNRLSWGSASRIFMVAIVLGFLVLWWYCLPAKLFDKPRSTVLLGSRGELLAAKIAADGQWRFPATDSVPDRFMKCLLTYEDRDFFTHHGISGSALLRAFRQNVSAGKIVSGASTITMQTMRMARWPQDRSFFQKGVELAWALRAELRYSKRELLAMYVSNAPFGGNVVGLDAAAWRYFQKPANALSWAECAALAVLPNAPAMIFPGRNSRAFRAKRDNLLETLYQRGIIDKETRDLALLEALPSTPHPLPDETGHLLARGIQQYPGRLIRTTLERRTQHAAAEILETHLQALRKNKIENAAILIASTETGEILAYVGNGMQENHTEGWANDMIATPRSSGSILKPFLFGAMIRKGEITPRTLIPDIPTQYSGFSPSNYDNSFSGAVPAEEALARSLNIPAVRMLREYGTPGFHQDLQKLGFTTVTESPSHYGLSLILGGAEVTLWDLVNAYRMMGNVVNRYPASPAFIPIHYTANTDTLATYPLDAAACWATLEAMTKVIRPDEQASWETFGGSQKIGWKTGTSYGFRDAWAVGVTPAYTVGVWVGNASGTGRPGINGLYAAAPVLFEVFNALPQSRWFNPPADLLQMEKICTFSGMLATENCEKTAYVRLPKASIHAPGCTYCQVIHLDATEKFRVSSSCYSTLDMKNRKRFVLDPLQGFYYAKYHPEYDPLPPLLPGCEGNGDEDVMRMIYPRPSSAVFIPRELGGEKEKIILSAAHNRGNALIYWHINDLFIGVTANGRHEMQIEVPEGKYHLTLVDDHGNRYETIIRVETR